MRSDRDQLGQMPTKIVIKKEKHFLIDETLKGVWDSDCSRKFIMSILQYVDDASVYLQLFLVNKSCYTLIMFKTIQLPFFRDIIRFNKSISNKDFIEYCRARVIIDKIKNDEKFLLKNSRPFYSVTHPNLVKVTLNKKKREVINYGSFGLEYDKIMLDESSLYSKMLIKTCTLRSQYVNNKLYELRFKKRNNGCYDFKMRLFEHKNQLRHSKKCKFKNSITFQKDDLFSYQSLGLVYKAATCFIWLLQKETKNGSVIFMLKQNRDEAIFVHHNVMPFTTINNILYNPNTNIISMLVLISKKVGSKIWCIQDDRIWECIKEDDKQDRYIDPRKIINTTDMTDTSNLLVVGRSFLISNRKCPTQEKDFINLHYISTGELVI